MKVTPARPSVARWVMAYGLTATWVLFTTGTIGGTIRTPWGIARLFDLSFLLTPGVWAVFSAIYFLCVFAFMRRMREALVGKRARAKRVARAAHRSLHRPLASH